MNRIIVSLLFLSFATFAAAEESFTPRTEFEVNSYSELASVTADIWKTYSDRKQAAYKVQQQQNLAAFKKFEELRLQALDRLSDADWEHYAQWLDARERGDYGRVHELETNVPALKEYVTEYERIHAIYQQTRKEVELRYKAVEMAADHVRDIEELNAEQAFQFQGN